ncbi:MAG: helix-turn-helix transcriptional regulator [Gammaproteobacteria bacterium]|nr:helix-turn-helix transcriptional regulator [Gammaproteobacteria bacterium]
MSLGATVCTLRKARGLTLSDIEQLTRINKGALSRFERDLEGLGSENFDRLCILFGTTPAVLYAVAKFVSKHPEIIEDGTKLHKLVRSLTRLIDRYLSASDQTRLLINKLLD